MLYRSDHVLVTSGAPLLASCGGFPSAVGLPVAAASLVDLRPQGRSVEVF